MPVSFILTGYSTVRSGIVVAWEAIVMLRKLAVTLAGSTIQDPYLQILAALLILVFSCVATAFIQPYEVQWLNLLDTFGLLTLITTQIFSILYFYVVTAAEPITNPFTIEIIVTTLLFGINAIMICVLLGFFIRELFGLRQMWLEKRSRVFAVASADRTTAALANYGWGGGSSDLRWCHPNGVAVSIAPTASHVGIWKWIDTDGVVSVSMEHPKLLILIKSIDALNPGDEFHWVGKKSARISASQTKPHDVGGYVCGGVKKADEEDRRVAVDGDVELAVVQHDNALARRRAADDGVVAVGDDVPPGVDAPAAAALLAAERTQGTTVAELQAALQERDAALQEKEAENTQLKAEIEALRMQTRGAVVDLQVVAADASAARTAISDASEASIATGVDPGAKRWFFTYKNAIELHGPFALSELQAWHAGGHFTIDQPIHLGDGSPTIELKEAFQEAAWWFVADVDGSGSVSGPHALTLLKKWQTEGRVEDDQELHLGESGEATTLLAALRAVGLGLAREEVSGGREERRRKSVRAERRC